MIAVAERPAAAVPLEDLSPPTQAAVRALALAYLQYASGCWRGETLAPAFASRLGAYWRTEMPPEPATAPDAVSPHGAGGRGICWHQVGDDILGYIPGVQGGYHIPVGAVSRLAECACRVAPLGTRDERKSQAAAVA